MPRTGPTAIEIVLKLCKIRRPSKPGFDGQSCVQMALSCLPGASQAVQLILSCLPGASQAVQMVLSYLPGASLVPRWLSDGSFPASLVPCKLSNESFPACLVPLRLSTWSFPASLVPPCQRQSCASAWAWGLVVGAPGGFEQTADDAF